MKCLLIVSFFLIGIFYSYDVQAAKKIYCKRLYTDSPAGDYGVYVKNNNLSKPNLSLYKKGHQDYERVHVFLDNGVAIEVYVAEDGSAMISAFRWFEPTTKEEFMSRWGTDLVEKFVPEGN